MKRKKLITVVLLLCLCMATETIYGFLTDQAEKRNRMAIGENTIEPDEPFTPPPVLHPGDVFTKAPSLKNTGNVICYVRMFAECNDSRMEELISMDWNEKEWTGKQSDGYYYYKQPLQTGEKTLPLFTTVSVSEHADLEQLKDFQIIIYGESIQAGSGTNYEEAWKQL